MNIFDAFKCMMFRHCGLQVREEMISIDSLSCGATQAVEEVVMEGKNSLF